MKDKKLKIKVKYHDNIIPFLDGENRGGFGSTGRN